MFDIVILAILAISLLVGFFRGFVKEALSIVTWVVSIWLALRFYKEAGEFFSGLIGQEFLRNIAGFAAIFIASLMVLSMVSFLVGKIVSKTGIKGTDRVLGFIFGFVRAVLIIVLILFFGRAVSMDRIWQESKLVPYFNPIVEVINDLLPDGLRVDGIGDVREVLNPEGILDKVIDPSSEKK